MALLLDCQELNKSIGPRLLFDQVSFTVGTGDRIGLIGANGSGKSTLLRIISGWDEPDSGKVSLGTNIRVGYLTQDDPLDDNATATQTLLDALKDLPFDETERYSRVHAMLSRAEFDNYDIEVHTLSGGWRKRLAICCAFIRESDILVMDEPTNHLDLEGILWLEKLLAGNLPESPDAFILVSHDRIFLENLTTRILEISPAYPKGYLMVDGTYSTFLERKEKQLDQQAEQEARLANRLRRETEWLRRGPKARTTKAKYRIDEAYRLQDELAQVRTRNRQQNAIAVDFSATDRKTKKLLEARDISKSYEDRTLFANLDLVLAPGRRLGILGKNGCGKSTLMEILAGAGNQNGAAPDTGSIRIAEGINIVSFTQNREALNLKDTLRKALAPEGDSIIFRDQSLHVVTWAQKFLFRPDQLETPVGNLSGGEQARILLADLMRQPADILLLDEPTNDLDIPSLQVLEESLIDFPGAVVLVTHDRFLMDRVCDAILGFDGRGHVAFFADYGQCLEAFADADKPKEKPVPQPEKKKKSIPPGRLSYMDQREYDAMEETISKAEEEEQLILQALEQPEIASDPDQVPDYWKRLEVLRTEMERLYLRWDELENLKKRTK